jgi:hypothetical protein
MHTSERTPACLSQQLQGKGGRILGLATAVFLLFGVCGSCLILASTLTSSLGLSLPLSLQLSKFHQYQMAGKAA